MNGKCLNCMYKSRNEGAVIAIESDCVGRVVWQANGLIPRGESRHCSAPERWALPGTSGGLLFPGRIIQLPGGQLYAGKVGEQIGDRRGAAAAAVAVVAAAARDGRRGPKRTGQRAP